MSDARRYDLVAFDVDGTLVDHPEEKTVWEVLPRRFGTPGTPRPVVHAGLVDVATARLRDTEADVVAFGHSHQEALVETPHGTYLNPGYWFGRRTFARLDADGPALLRWADGTAGRLPRVPTASVSESLAPSL